jgi:beta-glucosidase
LPSTGSPRWYIYWHGWQLKISEILATGFKFNKDIMIYHRIKVVFVIAIASALRLNAQYTYPFQNPNLQIEQRIDNLLSLMTLDEKVSALSTNPSVPRLGVVGTGHVEGLHGLAKGGPSDWGHIDPAPSTIFPQAIGLAESWDKNVIKTVAFIEGYETRYIFQSPKYTRGGLVVRAPNADIGRDIRWGRTEECYGEDAWFNAQLVVEFVKGLQGDDSKYWLTASLMKHFLANSNEDDRVSSSSNFNERLFREYYSYPFYKGVTEGGSRAYMTAYNSYNGIPCIVHPVIKDITVNEWGQDGIVCSDGGAYTLLQTAHKYYPDKYIAAAKCVEAGINQFLDKYRGGVDTAILRGYLAETTIDSALRGVYRVMIKLGQLDPQEMVPYKFIGIVDTLEPWLTDKNKKAALEVTEKTIVLLKNENQLLPLDKSKIKNIAVIGPWADSVLLDWYSGTPPYTVSPLEGIKNKVGNSATIWFARNNMDNRAVELAKKADVVIFIAGNHPNGDDMGWAVCADPSYGREAVDRKSLDLPQESLIQEIYAVNPKTIVVLQSSFPYAINWTKANIPAILHMTHSSEETGNALANVLFGDCNPAGRLVQTWPKSINDLLPMMDYDITHGRTYMYSKAEPLYEFGYGLSYTTFEYSNLNVSSVSQPQKSGEVAISFDVKNTGNCDGDEVVQLYIRHLNSKVTRPNIELKGFSRVWIEKGKTQKVTLVFNSSDLAYWDETSRIFIVENEEVEILIGASSKDIRLKKNLKIMNF